jgi:CubicO group peptidase (beta-lactamase class C family)
MLTKPATLLLIAGLFCILLASGCTTSSSEKTAAVQNGTTLTGTTVTQNVTALIPQFDAYAEQTFNRSGVPGMAVAIVQNDSVIYMRCFGVANTTTGEPVTPDTRFQLASISKSFTSATIASMAGDGEISWDTKVATITPGFRLSDPWVSDHVTFRDLLSHRTGLPEYGGDDLQDLGYNRSEIIGRLRYINLTGDFRSSYAYSNIAFTSAGEAAAKRAGMPWEDLVAKRIFVPAGMNNTSARFADFVAAKNHADTYHVYNGTATAAVLYNDDVNSPAGGVSSTISDMTRYARLQLNDGSLDGKQLIDPTTLAETHTIQNVIHSDNTGVSGYGLGWQVSAKNSGTRVWHDGEFETGASTDLMLYPNEKMAVVIFSNGFPGGYSLNKAMLHGWDDLYSTGAVQKDWYAVIEPQILAVLQPGASTMNPTTELPAAPADAKPARSLDSYSGSYAQDYIGTVRIETNSTILRAYSGKSTTPMILYPYDGDTFRDTTTNTSVVFAIGSDGIATSVRFSQFDLPGRNGTFIRSSS